jgi:hypothetical protein
MTTNFPDSLNVQRSLPQASFPTVPMHSPEKTTTDAIAQESIKQFQEAQSNIASKFKLAIAKIKSHDL